MLKEVVVEKVGAVTSCVSISWKKINAHNLTYCPPLVVFLVACFRHVADVIDRVTMPT